jgi:hypothetical protein
MSLLAQARGLRGGSGSRSHYPPARARGRACALCGQRLRGRPGSHVALPSQATGPYAKRERSMWCLHTTLQRRSRADRSDRVLLCSGLVCKHQWGGGAGRRACGLRGQRHVHAGHAADGVVRAIHMPVTCSRRRWLTRGQASGRACDTSPPNRTSGQRTAARPRRSVPGGHHGRERGEDGAVATCTQERSDPRTRSSPGSGRTPHGARAADRSPARRPRCRPPRTTRPGPRTCHPRRPTRAGRSARSTADRRSLRRAIATPTSRAPPRAPPRSR